MEYTSISKVLDEFVKEQEHIILDQLNDLIKRGLLVIESTKPTLVQNADSDKISVQQSIRLTLKDIDYIEKLEKENQELKEKIMKLADIFSRN